jgi:hypothetical protein
VTASGLSADPKQYRTRLGSSPTTSSTPGRGALATWSSGEDRAGDASTSFGDPAVRAWFRTGVRFGVERRRPWGDHDGNPTAPAVYLWAVVPAGAQVPDARDRIVEYLVENFHDFVYV